MKDFIQRILEYKEKNKLTNEECANKLGITLEQMLEIIEGKTSLDEKQQSEVLSKVDKLRATKILDLFFKFGATIMALVALLLSINDNIKPNTLIILLSIGLLFSSIQHLPKIDKD
ncbi:MAG: hypothetical protein E7354_02040 [Clostridiales bacterium]|nr:hypothetical protein [Clostridiales bacterium]